MQLNTIKGWLYILLLLMLCIPMMQQRFNIIKDRPRLNGTVTATANPKFSWKAWWDGSYQEQKTNHLNDSMGFRPDLIRLNNELDFRAFRKLHANQVVIGKENYLYETPYIDAYCGRDYKGSDTITMQLVKLKMVQDTLQKLGKTFIMIYAPSKARYYPEYFPEEMECSVNARSNHEEALRVADSLGIRYINFNGWFNAMRSTTSHPLFSKLGTHWTNYGAALAADSLLKFLARERQIDGPVLHINSVRESLISSTNENGLDTKEDDLERGLNLMFPVAHQKFTYPDLVYDTAGKTRLKAIYIGDSFIWAFVDLQVLKTAHSYFEFWYYTNEVWTQDVFDGKIPMLCVPETDWHKTLSEADYIIMMHSECNHDGITSPFVKKAYNYYFGKTQ